MKLLLLALAAGCYAAGSDGFLKADLTLGFEKVKHHPKRIETEGSYYNDLELDSYGCFYILDLNVGTPPQKVRALLDTASSDVWAQQSYFHGNLSSTFHPTNETLEMSYGAGDFEGVWINETIGITDQFEISNYFMGYVNTTTAENAPQAIVGTGYKGNENSEDFYDNFLMRLKEDGITKSSSFSVWFEDQTSGSVIFGGVDEEKFEGELYEAPITRYISRGKDIGYVYYQLNLTSVTVDGEEVSSGKSCIWDLGTLYSSIDPKAYAKIGEKFNLTEHFDDEYGYAWTYECGTVDLSQEIEFTFGEKVLTYTLEDFQTLLEFFMSPAGIEGRSPYDVSNSTTCVVGIQPSNSPLLGIVFLKSLYTVFNMDRNTISFAKVGSSDDSRISVI